MIFPWREHNTAIILSFKFNGCRFKHQPGYWYEKHYFFLLPPNDCNARAGPAPAILMGVLMYLNQLRYQGGSGESRPTLPACHIATPPRIGSEGQRESVLVEQRFTDLIMFILCRPILLLKRPSGLHRGLALSLAAWPYNSYSFLTNSFLAAPTGSDLPRARSSSTICLSMNSRLSSGEPINVLFKATTLRQLSILAPSFSHISGR